MSPVLPNHLRDQIAGKRLIFTITTGRSGTRYLQWVLHYCRDVAGFHEPEPGFHRIMRAIQEDSSLARDFWINEKIPSILKHPESVYIETSHLFCKGFLEPLLDLGIVPDIIILRRPRRKVSCSLYELGTIPGRTENGKAFCLAPYDPDVWQIPDWEQLHDYQLCYWYCLETYRRAQKYRKRISDAGGKVARVWLKEVRSITGYIRLLRTLNLSAPAPMDILRYLRTRRDVLNPKKTSKNRESDSLDLDALEKEVDDRFAEEHPTLSRNLRTSSGLMV